MSVALLLVEGDLDAQLMFALLAGAPPVERGGAKNQLAPRVRQRRAEGQVGVAYLRDRDFDYDPEPGNTPCVDRALGGSPLGWRWRRHEIENYLLDPVLAAPALGIPSNDYVESIRDAARKTLAYQVARWTVGACRRVLPPSYDLTTRPTLNDQEFALPPDLEEAASKLWVRSHVGDYFARVESALGPNAVEAEWLRRRAEFQTLDLSSPATILLWWSGKDLFAAMAESLAQWGHTSPGAARAVIRNHVLLNPVACAALIPEWASLRELLQAA